MEQLRKAIKDGELETVIHLIDTIDNIDELAPTTSATSATQTGWTLLDDAIIKGNVEIVKFLIHKGADVHLKRGTGNYLHMVSNILDPKYIMASQIDPRKKKDYEEIARILIEAGVDATKEDWRGPKGVPINVKVINIATNTKRQMELPRTGLRRKLISQINLTLGSSLCSHVMGFSRYNPKGSDRNKSILINQRLKIKI